MPLRTLIVDDEPDARENLRIMLEDTCPEVEVAALASGAEHARELIALHHPQALFLDIKMPGEDGFSLLRSISHLELPVVFTTAYDGFALQAFRQNALDYLEKPIDPEDLRRAVRKLIRIVGDPDDGAHHHASLDALINDPDSPLSKRVAVPGRDGLVLIRHEDITHLEASNSYTTV
ncbi:MAG TPA: response regulator, partial [Flavobacteriales bacterium]|nr:response regulator [Flavobacteriales bacterium]